MSKKKLQEKVQELVSLREMAAELADEIKADMDRQGVDTLEAGKHTIRWAVVKSSRFDSRAFRETYPSIYDQYTKSTEVRRFTVA
mgnify:CR=1 FL=1